MEVTWGLGHGTLSVEPGGLRLTVGDPAGVAWAVENLDPVHISPGAGGMAVFHPDTRGL